MHVRVSLLRITAVLYLTSLSTRFQVILDAMDMMGIPLGSSRSQQLSEIIMNQPHQIEADYLDTEVTEAIMGLWQDSGVRECFGRSREFQLNDSAQ